MLHNELHGLCQNCIPKCTETLHASREDQCDKCKENQPDIIVEQENQLLAICNKCYQRQMSSPSKKSEMNSSVKINQEFYKPVQKIQYLNKSFFTSQGKMIKKIEKLFTKYQKFDDLLKDLSKKSLVAPPFSWQKIQNKCDKVSSLMFVFISKNFIVGAYHNESLKMTQKSSFEDSESGIFVSERSKIDIQFYKLGKNFILYNSKDKMISFGNPSGLDIIIDKNARIKTELINIIGVQWIYQFVYRL